MLTRSSPRAVCQPLLAAVANVVSPRGMTHVLTCMNSNDGQGYRLSMPYVVHEGTDPAPRDLSVTTKRRSWHPH